MYNSTQLPNSTYVTLLAAAELAKNANYDTFMWSPTQPQWPVWGCRTGY